MKKVIIGCFFFLTLASPARSQEVADLIRENMGPHPRLFFHPGEEINLRNKILHDPLLTRAYHHVLEMAEAFVDIEPVTRIKVGHRMLATSRTALRRITYLSMAYRLTGDLRFLDRAQKEMLAAAQFVDWNPDHFLDAAEMTAALAIGYDWLYADLDLYTRQTLQNAIVEKGLKASFPGRWWVDTENNWNQVVHAGLIMGALATMESHPDLAQQVIERGITHLPKAMAEYDPDGAYPEGPGYWRYGTTFNVLGLAALESALGTTLGLADHSGFMATGSYYLQMAGTSGFSFNYSDNGTHLGVSPAMYWLAERTQNPSLLWQERRELEKYLAQEHDSEGQADRFFPLLLLWSASLGPVTAPEMTHWVADGRNPLAVLRTGWTAEDTYLGIKAGSPSSNHGHMDIGSFVMDALGVRWATDLGVQNYNSLESAGVDLWNESQESQRWDVFRLGPYAHNILIFDEQKQWVDSSASITHFSDEGAVIVDLKDIYANQVNDVRRGYQLLPDRTVLIQDEIQTLDRKTQIHWGMVTRAQVEIVDHQSAILTQDTRALHFKVLYPEDVQIEIFDIENPPNSYDERNENTRKIGFEIQVPASSESRIVVWLNPGIQSDVSPVFTPLETW